MARFSFKNLFGGTPRTTDIKIKPSVIATGESAESTDNIGAFDNSRFTYSGDITQVDFNSILINKQDNINQIYQLSDYFTDSNPIVHGINKHVYVPFANGEWYLTSENQKTIDIFEEHYKKIRLSELIADIFLQLFKYNNVFVYKWNGFAKTLPPHKCTIANIMIDGTPVVDFDVQSLQYEFKQRTYSLLEQPGVKDEKLEDILKGYPPEIAKAIRKGEQKARLDPKNCFVIQGDKEGWLRYAIPWIVSAFPALAKTALIEKYEASLLNVGARSFLHVTYGDSTKGQEMYPDEVQIKQLRRIITAAMQGKPLAVTNHLVKCQTIQFDMSELYENPLYAQVNADILSAGGIAGIIVNGESEEGSTFASAQVSMKAAEARIESARREVEDFMNKFNRSLVEDIRLVRTNNLKQIPEFHFKPLGINGKEELRKAGADLWKQGLLSTETYLSSNGYSLEKEKARREKERDDGYDGVMIPRDKMYEAVESLSTKDEDANSVGRPKMTDDERHSDPENAIRSKQAKDSESGDLSADE